MATIKNNITILSLFFCHAMFGHRSCPKWAGGTAKFCLVERRRGMGGLIGGMGGLKITPGMFSQNSKSSRLISGVEIMNLDILFTGQICPSDSLYRHFPMDCTTGSGLDLGD
ncbi:MAG: hypothetical protein GY696_37380 [Gammaproteobacteria bacterium]|nr:hypothetical protein [Gammaproteobacteria bacterium]